MSSFHGFTRLPCELRLSIWEKALPSAGSKTLKSLIQALAHLILSQTRDMFYGRGAPSKYDDANIKYFTKENASPYADLAACPESRTVALKHLKKLISGQKDLRTWLRNPKFPFTNPQLIVREREGKLVYRCANITDGFDLESYVFSKFFEPRPRLFVGLAAHAEFIKTTLQRHARLTTHEDRGRLDYCDTDEAMVEDTTRSIVEEGEVSRWDDEGDSEEDDVPSKT